MFTSKALAEQGKKGFYEGKIAEAVVSCVQAHGGVMTLEDMKDHKSTFDTPIKTTYRGIDVWEMPPNGQGITALMALNILEGFDFSSRLINHVSVCLSVYEIDNYTSYCHNVCMKCQELL